MAVLQPGYFSGHLVSVYTKSAFVFAFEIVLKFFQSLPNLSGTFSIFNLSGSYKQTAELYKTYTTGMFKGAFNHKTDHRAQFPLNPNLAAGTQVKKNLIASCILSQCKTGYHRTKQKEATSTAEQVSNGKHRTLIQGSYKWHLSRSRKMHRQGQNNTKAYTRGCLKRQHLQCFCFRQRNRIKN